MQPEPAGSASSLSVRAYRAALPRFVKAQRVAHGLFVGAFLGFMDRAALAAVDADFYDRRREPVGDTALAYADPRHIRSGLAAWEAAALTRHFPEGGRIVVTAAGAGREVYGARALGLRAAGYEPHAGLVRAGNAFFAQEGLPERLAACERDAFPDAGRADGVVVGWGSYSHIPSRARRVAFLTAARATLDAGAPLLLSFWAIPGRDRYFKVLALAARPGRWIIRGEAAEVGDVLSPMFVHCFRRAEIEGEGRSAGFEPVFYAEEPYPHAVLRAV